MSGDEKLPAQLNITAIDRYASLLKGVVGAVPFAGSLLAELLGAIIPNQRMDRLVAFTLALQKMTAHLDESFIRAKLTDNNFTDLLEEGVRQAAQSLSDERRQYIAAVVAKGLTADAVSFAESKHLLQILGEVNDVEVLILRAHVPINRAQYELDKGFFDKHADVISPKHILGDTSGKRYYSWTLYTSYLKHLTRLGLLRYDPPQALHYSTEYPAFDEQTGSRTGSVHHLEYLGILLLQRIDLWPSTILGERL